MKCAIYIRKSRENDSKPGYRLTVQREQLPAFAKQQGWSSIIYDDGHASAARGKVEQLPERSKLETDIRAGKVDIVLVIELSRLSRDDTMQDYVAWLTLCADYKVKLATLTRTLDPSENSDWMLLLMEGGFSSVEMKVLTGRMAEGRRQAFLAGKFLGGQCPKPYAYDKAEKKPVVDETLLKECETIWTLAETMSAKAIAEKQDLAEITVRRMISDDRLLFYQALRVDPETGEQISCEWDPVMTAERAERIRAGRRTRKTNSTRRDFAGLLSGLGIFYCGYCGKTVKSWNNSKIRQDGSRLDYYACVTKNRQNACPKSRMIDHTTVNEKVIKNLLFTLSKNDELKKFWDMSQQEKKDSNQTGKILDDIKEQEQKKQNLVGAIADGLLEFSDAKQQIDSIKSNILNLQTRLSQQEPIQVIEPDWNSLKWTSEEFGELTPEEQRLVIKSSIESVTLYNTYATINYLFPRTISGETIARINFTNKGKVERKSKIRSRRKPTEIKGNPKQ